MELSVGKSVGVDEGVGVEAGVSINVDKFNCECDMYE